MAKSKIITVSIPAELHEEAKKRSLNLLGRENLSAYVAYLIKKEIGNYSK